MEKRKCKEKKQGALKLTDNTQPSDGSRFKYKEQFDKLPGTIDELLDKINEIEGQVECMAGDNDNVN